MDRMSPLDAAFLEAEDEDRHTSMAIASIAVFTGTPPTHQEMLDALASRLPLIPRYRQRVRRPLLDLGAPVWVDDPDFDLSYHVRRTALPRPGGDAELHSLMARVMSQRLDRERPLWENWVVEGLRAGRWALISKVHHCMVDGVSGTELYHLLLSTSPDDVTIGPYDDDWVPSAEPSTLGLTARALADVATSPAHQVALVARALRAPRRTGRRIAVTTRGLAALAGAVVPPAGSTLTGRAGAQRRYGTGVVSLRDVKQIRRHYGVTINDVALAATTAGFRELLLARGDLCAPNTVRTLVPVSVRANGDEGIPDNRVSCLLADLPVHVPDSVQRLHAVHRHLEHLKATHEAEAGEAITSLAAQEPFPLVSPLVRAGFRWPQRTIVTVTTNVPGPREPLYLLGRPMVHLLPYVPIAAQLRIGVAIMSYCDDLAFGVTGDHDTTADLALLTDAMTREVQTLLATTLATTATSTVVASASA